MDLGPSASGCEQPFPDFHNLGREPDRLKLLDLDSRYPFTAHRLIDLDG